MRSTNDVGWFGGRMVQGWEELTSEREKKGELEAQKENET